VRAFPPKQAETPHAKAQNEVPAADANGTPALERVQAVWLSRRRSRLCRTNFRPA